MEEFEPVPGDDAGRERWQSGTDTFDRVYDVILGLTSPSTASEVAELADCSQNAARKHLDRLADMGVVRAARDAPPVRYTRDEGFLEWQEASRIARALSVDEIVERVRALEERRADYEVAFGTTDPTAVSALDGDDHDAVHERMARLSDWRAIEHDIQLYELARRLATNDGRLLPA